MNLAYLNPLTLLRWVFFGKNLDEIIDFDKKRLELDAFHARTERRKERKETRMAQLAAQNAVHADQMGRAKLTSDNLLVIMTKSLATKPAEAA